MLFYWLALVVLGTLLLRGLASLLKLPLTWIWAALSVIASFAVTSFYGFYFHAMMNAAGIPDLVGVALALGSGYLVFYLIMRKACQVGWAKALLIFIALLLGLAAVLRVLMMILIKTPSSG